MAPTKRECSTSNARLGGGVEAGFTSPAQFVEANRGEWSDQGKARRNGKCKKRQQRIARHERDQAQSDQRIDHA